MDGASNARAQAATSIAFSEINRLAAIKTKEGKEGVEAAAKQFESLFIDLVLKGMREANKAFSEGNYLNSFETELHQEMLDHQWAIHLAEHGGVGLADVIVRQLSGADCARRDEGLARVAATPAVAVPQPGELPSAAGAELGTTGVQVTAVATAGLDTAEFPIAVRTSGSKGEQFDGPINFVKKLLPVVRDVLAGTPLNPLAVLAQAALETGWGRQVIHSPDGRSTHNLFGVKAGKDWDGDAVEVTTVEFHGGRPRRESAQFRAYGSWGEALGDYLKLVTDSERYRSAVAHEQEPERYAKELQVAGYATDPDYATKIRRILSSEAMEIARELLEEILPTHTSTFDATFGTVSTSVGD